MVFAAQLSPNLLYKYLKKYIVLETQIKLLIKSPIWMLLSNLAGNSEGIWNVYKQVLLQKKSSFILDLLAI